MSIVLSTNNTTQFGNFTIEWQNFDILSCTVPIKISVSLFSCISPAYTQVQDISCLQETDIDFPDSICQPTTTTTAVDIISFNNIIQYYFSLK